MFVGQLTFEERRSLLRLAASVAAADGTIDPRESLRLAELASRLSLSIADFTDQADVPLATLCEAFTRPEARRIALIELLNTAWADGEYAGSERTQMGFIAELMGVDAEVLAALEVWVEDGQRWEARGRALLAASPDALA